MRERVVSGVARESVLWLVRLCPPTSVHNVPLETAGKSVGKRPYRLIVLVPPLSSCQLERFGNIAGMSVDILAKGHT
jgi:hypothetical protein